jgi:hypothetical protein
MATIIHEMDERLLSDALAVCLERRIGLGAFINEVLRTSLLKPGMPFRDIDNVQEVLERTLNVVRSKTPGERFFFKDVCSEDDWAAIKPNDRKSFGKKFRKAVENPASPIAHFVERATNNQAIYERI